MSFRLLITAAVRRSRAARGNQRLVHVECATEGAADIAKIDSAFIQVMRAGLCHGRCDQVFRPADVGLCIDVFCYYGAHAKNVSVPAAR